jgi:hypothetical protein
VPTLPSTPDVPVGVLVAVAVSSVGVDDGSVVDVAVAVSSASGATAGCSETAVAMGAVISC